MKNNIPLLFIVAILGSGLLATGCESSPGDSPKSKKAELTGVKAVNGDIVSSFTPGQAISAAEWKAFLADGTLSADPGILSIPLTTSASEYKAEIELKFSPKATAFMTEASKAETVKPTETDLVVYFPPEGVDDSITVKDNEFLYVKIVAEDKKTTKYYQIRVVWDIESYTVTFDKNGGDVDANPTSKTVRSGTFIGNANMPAPPTREGYAFSGWANQGGTAFTGTTAVTANITVFAQWVKDIIVTFDKNGGTTEANPPTITVIWPKTTVETLPAEPSPPASPPGQVFAGWNTTASDTPTPGSVFLETTTVTEDIKVYARWVVPFIVTFDKNGGDTEADPKTKTVIPPATTVDALPATNPTRTGKSFAGWYTVTTDTGGTRFTASTPVENSFTVYARWRDPVDSAATPVIEKIVVSSNEDKTGTVFKVTATTSDEGELSYRWYRAQSDAGLNQVACSDSDLYSGSLTDTFTTKYDTIRWYHVQVTNTLDYATTTKTVTVSSFNVPGLGGRIEIKGDTPPEEETTYEYDPNAIKPQAPIIEKIVVEAIAEGTRTQFTVTATPVTDGGTLTYMWYRAQDATDSATENACTVDTNNPDRYLNGDTLSFSTNYASARWYYVKVTNTLNGITTTTDSTNVPGIARISIAGNAPPSTPTTYENTDLD